MQQINIDIFFFIGAVKKYRKLFFTVNIIGFLVAVVVAFALPISYESKVVFYPYSPEASDPRSFFGEQLKFNVFSDVDQSEKFVLMAKSNTIKQAIISKYQLKTRYKIEGSLEESNFKVLEEFEKNIKIKKEENGGIIISAFDVNRDTAALIANEIVAQIEQMNVEIVRAKNIKILEVLKSNFEKSTTYVAELREKKNQSGSNADVNKELDFALEDFTKLKFKYEQTQAMVGNDMKLILVIEAATASYRKARPFRSLIVGGSLILVFLVSVIGIGAFEFIRQSE